MEEFNVDFSISNSSFDADFGNVIKGDPGEPGDPGTPGKNGTSVTITKIQESTEDGGENVVTFSDGKTMTVKNGRKGNPGENGKTPVKGIDYYNDADKAEFSSYIATELAKRGQLKPEFANSVEECTDTTKMYVLPDGFIYAYFEKESDLPYTNLLPLADVNTFTSNDLKTATKKEGYFEGVRLNSSGNMVAQSGSYVTGFIPYKYGGEGDKIRVKNTGWCSSGNTMGVWAYDANHVFISELVTFGKGTSTNFDEMIANSGNGTAGRGWSKESDGQYMTTFVPSQASGIGNIDTSKIAYVRIFMGDFSNAVITINEEIVSGGSAGGLDWHNTGHAFVPADYEKRILELEKRIDNIGTNNTSGTIDLAYIREWDMPIYDANIPVFETTATKAAISENELNCASLYAKYDALMAQYPAYITKKDHGLCSDGVTHMYQYDIKTPKTYSTGSLFSEVKPKAILMSGIHREYACAYGLYYAIEEIVSNPDLRHFLNNVHLIVFPCANPYAFNKDNGTHYQNANGVEIHRNFEVGFVNYETEGDDQYSGSAPLSEIESQVIDGVMRTNKDSAFVMSAHTYNNAKDGTTDHRVMWCSAGTLYTCNLACRLIQKMSVSFRKRFGNQFTGDDLSEPMGYVSVSGTGGSEYRQATKYGIQGFNLEVSETFSPIDTTQRTSFAMTRYAEVYANMIITAFGVYDYKDKDKYCKYVK